MSKIAISREEFLADSQGKTFSDVVNDPDQPFALLLEFFSDPHRQQRMEESELHHDRAPLAGVVLELEAIPEVDAFLGGVHTQRSTRLRQAIGVIVRMIMERKGWKTTGRKGSLGVRATPEDDTPPHNTGGLAFWFIRAERYERVSGMPYRSAHERCEALHTASQASLRNKAPAKVLAAPKVPPRKKS